MNPFVMPKPDHSQSSRKEQVPVSSFQHKPVSIPHTSINPFLKRKREEALPRLEEVFEQLLAYVALAFWGWSGKERKLLLFRRHLTNAIAMTTIKCQGLI
ncbi:hypothetical protein RHMOL_Rhmol08G0275200 [Rhododendron molle]|uniref:Uncharacterized protein n=1 Tax=Rhododendron molle TaxID=49168 RepID=A0ACC0MT70_RHOML|nr:hypothetical protein RHMOL_Rhmol08G0275200 [Rhododendron molle]